MIDPSLRPASLAPRVANVEQAGTTGGLTDEQAAIVHLPAEARALVTAGPGTGKTHTLVARLAHLVESGEVAPGAVLAISFTRSAVAEVRRRLTAHGTDARAVRPTTLDSFASRIIRSAADGDDTWKSKSFDDRIAIAMALLDQAGEVVDSHEHICVDELQDLVGVRAKFVRALIERSSGGFTLFGDPAQGIYNFSLPSSAAAESDGSPQMYRWLLSNVERMSTHSLTINHRVTSSRLNEIFAARDILNGAASPSLSHTLMDEQYRTLAEFPSVRLLARTPAPTTAILCRDNGDALAIAEQLRAAGASFSIRRGASDRSLPVWLSLVAQKLEGGRVSRERFYGAFAALAPLPAVECDVAWAALRRMARDKAGIDFDRFARSVNDGAFPDELTLLDESPTTVSTIHRAKGLEFDRVVIVDKPNIAPEIDDAEEARVLFVAMTRARSELYRLQPNWPNGRRRVKHPSTGRWTERGFKDWHRYAMEVGGGDVDHEYPPGSAYVTGGPVDVQALLLGNVRAGDSVTLAFIRCRADDNRIPIYRIDWQGQCVGATSSSFGLALHAELKVNSGWDVKWPMTLEGCVIDTIESVAGSPAQSRACGLGFSGFWLAPRLVGLGHYRFPSSKDASNAD